MTRSFSVLGTVFRWVEMRHLRPLRLLLEQRLVKPDLRPFWGLQGS